MVGGCGTRGNKRRTAYNNGSKREANGDEKIYCVRSKCFSSIILGILLECVGTNARNRGSMAAEGCRGIECVGSTVEEYLNFVDVRSIGNVGTSWKGRR